MTALQRAEYGDEQFRASAKQRCHSAAALHSMAMHEISEAICLM